MFMTFEPISKRRMNNYLAKVLIRAYFYEYFTQVTIQKQEIKKESRVRM